MTSYRNVIYGAILVVSGLMVVFTIGMYRVYNSFLRSLSVVGYVSFNSEKVDTIYSVVGSKKLCSYSSYIESGKERYELKYCDKALSEDDFVKYSVYLLGEGFVLTKDDKGNGWYVKESIDNNKVIGVYLDESGSTIVYQKADGYLYEDSGDSKMDDSKYL